MLVLVIVHMILSFMLWFIKHWRHYLFHREFILFTDHDALKHLDSQAKVYSRHATWVVYLHQFTFTIHHQAGKLNRVADVLSRRHALVSTMHTLVTGFTTFSDLYCSDPYFSKILGDVSSRLSTEFSMHDGFLFRGNQLCIPDCSLRLQIINELHTEGHVGHDRTLQLVTSSYFCPSLHHDVGRFVEQCRLC